MKIIHIHPNLRMGKIFVKPLIDFEKSIGHTSQLISFNKSYQNNEVNFDLSLTSVKMFLDIFRFILFLKKQKPNIIFCHNSTQALIPLILSKIVGVKKIIYFNHGITYLGYRGFLKFSFYNLEKLNAFFSHITITVSPYMKKKLDKIKPNAKIIHNGSACGINLEKMVFKLYQNKKPPIKKVIISFLGRLHVRKGINTLIKILNYFNNNERIKFNFFGFTEEEFLKFSKTKYKNLQCFGFVKDPSFFLKKSNILILPSLHEGLPYSLLEGMLNQNLILANNIPGIDDLIKNGHNGFLINENNSEEYISLINDYLNNKIDIKKMLQNSLEVLKKYDRSKFMLDYSKFLNKIE